MKKTFFAILILAFLIMPSVLGVSLDLKKNYSPRETLITKISGNFLDPIQPENILFYSDRLKIPMEYELAKLDNYFYLYAILPNKERNYTLIIKDAHYFEAGSEKTQDLEFNFSVSGKIADFTVDPGFIITSKDFIIGVESNTEDMSLNIKYLNFTTTASVHAGFPTEIPFQLIPYPNVTLLEIKTKNLTYQIPVKSMAQTVYRQHLSFTKPFLNLTIFRGSPYNLQLYLANDGNEVVNNIAISSTPGMTFEPSNIPSIMPNSYEAINLTLLPEEDSKITVFASSGQLSTNMTIQVNLIKVSIENLTEEEIDQLTCIELGGQPCEEGQTCSGEIAHTLDTPDCCVGKCSSKSRLFLIVLLIIGIAAVAYYIFIFRKKKKLIPESIKHSAIGKLSEVRGSLSKT